MPPHGVRGGQVSVLPDEDIKGVHQATLDALNDVGIRLPHAEALGLWADHGARIDPQHEIVRIPEHGLMKALASAPRRVTLYGKTPEWDVALDTLGTAYTMGGAGALWVLDPEDGYRRPSTLRDLEELTRLQDALPNMDIAHFLVLPQDIPQEGAEYPVFAAMLKHTRRPHHTLPGSRQCVRDQVEMAAVIAGSTQAVRERPPFFENICVLSTLFQPWETTDQLIECARQRLPMLIEADTIAGGTAPVTIAGALVEMNANVLSAIALAQLVSPGTPCIHSSSSGVMDMQAANYSAAAPESTLLHMASTQAAHFYGLPHQGGNTPDAKVPDAQMGYERASHFLALTYAREGAAVVIANRSEHTGREAVTEIEQGGGKALFLRTDIRSRFEVDSLVQRTLEAFGRIDILVNNAGVANAFAPFLEVSPEMYGLVGDTNLRGTFFVSQRVARVMVQQARGKIVIISSNLAEIAQPGTCHYMCTKGGLNSFTKGLALELSPYNICVNAIAPGEIYVENASEFFDHPANRPRFDAVPLRRFGFPQDVAGAAVFLAADEADCITGATIVVDGGQSIV